MRPIALTVSAMLAALLIAAPASIAAPAPGAGAGHYTPGSTPAVSYPSDASSGGSYTPGSISPVSYPSGAVGAETAPVGSAGPGGTPTTDGGVSATAIALGIAGSLLAVANLAIVVRCTRRVQRTRVAA